MALLNADHRSRWAWRMGGLALLGLGSCALVESLFDHDSRFAFSHRIHAEELECTDCHQGAEEAEKAGTPLLGQCLLCHDAGDEDSPPERRIGSLFDPEGRFLTSDVNAFGDEVVFSHPDHVSMAPDCATCHVGIEENDDVRSLTPVRMDACIRCHEALSVPADCSTCHRELGPETPPNTHHHNWMKAHGTAFRAGSDAAAARCDLCHQESSCKSCHLVTPPQNHTTYWRRRGHSNPARMDRDSCATCHRTDSCASCHAAVAPANHSGMWGSVRNTHCLSCHFPIRSEGCATCHPATPSHAGAAPLPADHSPALNCRQCHGLSVPLPHVDKGDECILCHR